MESEEDKLENVLKEKGLSMPNKRKESMRNLSQYRKMSDEEFEDYWIKRQSGMEPSAEFERRIQAKLRLFEKDYDLSDMKINDTETLRALIQTILALEDLEQEMFMLRSMDITEDIILSKIERLNKVMSIHRADINSFQESLKISRRVRKSDKDASAISFLEDLKKKAKVFYESKMSFVYCPGCNQLLGTVWVLYPDAKANRIKLVCKRDLGEKGICNTEVVVSTQELLEKGGTNIPQIVPESLL